VVVDRQLIFQLGTMRPDDTRAQRWQSDTDPRPSVSVKDRGIEVVVLFDDESFKTIGAEKADVVEIRLQPAKPGPLDAGALSALMPRAGLYVRYARALSAMDFATLEDKAKLLRDFGSTKRGLSDELLETIAGQYLALEAEGEPHLVKAIATVHSVDISTASKWISRARSRGFLPPKDGTDG
jgi:hypothetical protein